MDIPTSSDALDVDFHPSSSSNLLVAGLISGKVQLIDFRHPEAATRLSGQGTTHKGKEKQYEKRWTTRPSNKSCRGVAFSKRGDSVFSLAKDGSMHRLDVETGSVVSTWDQAHEAAPSRILPIDENLIATGDDDGVVSLWDPRKPSSSSNTSAVRTYNHHFDWITSMLWCTHLAPPKKVKLTKEEEEKKKAREEKKRKRKEKRGKVNVETMEEEPEEEGGGVSVGGAAQRERLVVTSGDGTLSVIDIRTGKAGVQVSEDQEDELLSIASVKRDSKLVVGTQLGILSLWAPTKGLLDHVDRIPGHPSSVDAMCTLDDDTILTGSSDGLVRVVQILPHQLLGIVADHGGMPVERLARRDNWLASIGHGSEIKITDLAPLLEEGDGTEDDGEAATQPFGLTSLSAAVGEDESDESDEEGEEELQAYSQDESGEGKDSDDEDEKASQPALKKVRGATFLRPVTQSKEDASTTDFFADL